MDQKNTGMPTNNKAANRGNNGAGAKAAGHHKNTNNARQGERTERERLKQAALEKEDNDLVLEVLEEPLLWMKKTVEFILQNFLSAPLCHSIIPGADLPLHLSEIRSAAELLIATGEERDRVIEAVDSASTSLYRMYCHDCQMRAVNEMATNIMCAAGNLLGAAKAFRTR